MNNYLMEAFCKTGTTDANEFFALCKDIDSHTSYIKVSSPELRSFNEEDEETGTLMYKGTSLGFSGLEANLNDVNEAEALYNELIAVRAPIVCSPNGDAYLATNKAVAEIAALRGLHGSPINVPSLERDAYVDKLARGLDVTFVARKIGDVTRILSTRSSKYGPIPMETLKAVYDGFMSSDWIGSYEVKNWVMTQDEGVLYIEFPELAANMKTAYPNVPDDFIPGVIFHNGTTGYCTLNAEMTYRRQNSDNLIVVGKIAAKHFAGFTPDSYIKRMQNECWGLYTQMPEKLDAATQVTVTDLDAQLEKLFKFIKLNKVFQKKDTETCKYLEKIRTKALDEIHRQASLVPEVTLYDIINVVMSVPENIVVPDAYKELLKESCGRAWQYEA